MIDSQIQDRRKHQDDTIDDIENYMTKSQALQNTPPPKKSFSKPMDNNEKTI